jgi:hypothetical protein
MSKQSHPKSSMLTKFLQPNFHMDNATDSRGSNLALLRVHANSGVHL